MRKLIFVLIDGLTRSAAKENMGYLWHMAEYGYAGYADVKGELPSVSRPCYETIFTGVPACKHGITANNITRKSTCENIFSLARKNNLKTAAAAYYWISELYNRSPFNPVTERHYYDEKSDIQYGCFYFDDAYPDSHVFSDAEYLRNKYDPDILLVHPMGIDYAGHLYGSMSKEYESKTVGMDAVLANFIPLWMNEGYAVIVTSDHGMSEMGFHGGNKSLLRDIPLFVFNADFTVEGGECSQLDIAFLLCRNLDIEPSITMKICDLKNIQK